MEMIENKIEVQEIEIKPVDWISSSRREDKVLPIELKNYMNEFIESGLLFQRIIKIPLSDFLLIYINQSILMINSSNMNFITHPTQNIEEKILSLEHFGVADYNEEIKKITLDPQAIFMNIFFSHSIHVIKVENIIKNLDFTPYFVFDHLDSDSISDACTINYDQEKSLLIMIKNNQLCFYSNESNSIVYSYQKKVQNFYLINKDYIVTSHEDELIIHNLNYFALESNNNYSFMKPIQNAKLNILLKNEESNNIYKISYLTEFAGQFICVGAFMKETEEEDWNNYEKNKQNFYFVKYSLTNGVIAITKIIKSEDVFFNNDDYNLKSEPRYQSIFYEKYNLFMLITNYCHKPEMCYLEVDFLNEDPTDLAIFKADMDDEKVISLLRDGEKERMFLFAGSEIIDFKHKFYNEDKIYIGGNEIFAPSLFLALDNAGKLVSYYLSSTRDEQSVLREINENSIDLIEKNVKCFVKSKKKIIDLNLPRQILEQKDKIIEIEEKIFEELKKERPINEILKKEEPKKEVPKKEELNEGEPNKEEPKNEVPKKEELNEGEPKKEEPKKEVPKKEEELEKEESYDAEFFLLEHNKEKHKLKKEEPKKEEPKEEEHILKIEEPKKEEQINKEIKKEEHKKENQIMKEEPKEMQQKKEVPKKEEAKKEAPIELEPKEKNKIILPPGDIVKKEVLEFEISEIIEFPPEDSNIKEPEKNKNIYSQLVPSIVPLIPILPLQIKKSCGLRYTIPEIDKMRKEEQVEREKQTKLKLEEDEKKKKLFDEENIKNKKLEKDQEERKKKLKIKTNLLQCIKKVENRRIFNLNQRSKLKKFEIEEIDKQERTKKYYARTMDKLYRQINLYSDLIVNFFADSEKNITELDKNIKSSNCDKLLDEFFALSKKAIQDKKQLLKSIPKESDFLNFNNKIQELLENKEIIDKLLTKAEKFYKEEEIESLLLSYNSKGCSKDLIKVKNKITNEYPKLKKQLEELSNFLTEMKNFKNEFSEMSVINQKLKFHNKYEGAFKKFRSEPILDKQQTLSLSNFESNTQSSIYSSIMRKYEKLYIDIDYKFSKVTQSKINNLEYYYTNIYKKGENKNNSQKGFSISNNDISNVYQKVKEDITYLGNDPRENIALYKELNKKLTHLFSNHETKITFVDDKPRDGIEISVEDFFTKKKKVENKPYMEERKEVIVQSKDYFESVLSKLEKKREEKEKFCIEMMKNMTTKENQMKQVNANTNQNFNTVQTVVNNNTGNSNLDKDKKTKDAKEKEQDLSLFNFKETKKPEETCIKDLSKIGSGQGNLLNKNSNITNDIKKTELKDEMNNKQNIQGKFETFKSNSNNTNDEQKKKAMDEKINATKQNTFGLFNTNNKQGDKSIEDNKQKPNSGFHPVSNINNPFEQIKTNIQSDLLHHKTHADNHNKIISEVNDNRVLTGNKKPEVNIEHKKETNSFFNMNKDKEKANVTELNKPLERPADNKDNKDNKEVNSLFASQSNNNQSAGFTNPNAFSLGSKTSQIIQRKSDVVIPDSTKPKENLPPQIGNTNTFNMSSISLTEKKEDYITPQKKEVTAPVVKPAANAAQGIINGIPTTTLTTTNNNNNNNNNGISNSNLIARKDSKDAPITNQADNSDKTTNISNGFFPSNNKQQGVNLGFIQPNQMQLNQKLIPAINLSNTNFEPNNLSYTNLMDKAGYGVKPSLGMGNMMQSGFSNTPLGIPTTTFGNMIGTSNNQTGVAPIGSGFSNTSGTMLSGFSSFNNIASSGQGGFFANIPNQNNNNQANCFNSTTNQNLQQNGFNQVNNQGTINNMNSFGSFGNMNMQNNMQGNIQNNMQGNMQNNMQGNMQGNIQGNNMQGNMQNQNNPSVKKNFTNDYDCF